MTMTMEEPLSENDANIVVEVYCAVMMETTGLNAGLITCNIEEVSGSGRRLLSVSYLLSAWATDADQQDMNPIGDVRDLVAIVQAAVEENTFATVVSTELTSGAQPTQPVLSSDDNGAAKSSLLVPIVVAVIVVVILGIVLFVTCNKDGSKADEADKAINKPESVPMMDVHAEEDVH